MEIGSINCQSRYSEDNALNIRNEREESKRKEESVNPLSLLSSGDPIQLFPQTYHKSAPKTFR